MEKGGEKIFFWHGSVKTNLSTLLIFYSKRSKILFEKISEIISVFFQFLRKRVVLILELEIFFNVLKGSIPKNYNNWMTSII